MLTVSRIRTLSTSETPVDIYQTTRRNIIKTDIFILVALRTLNTTRLKKCSHKRGQRFRLEQVENEIMHNFVWHFSKILIGRTPCLTSETGLTHSCSQATGLPSMFGITLIKTERQSFSPSFRKASQRAGTTAALAVTMHTVSCLMATKGSCLSPPPRSSLTLPSPHYSHFISPLPPTDIHHELPTDQQ